MDCQFARLGIDMSKKQFDILKRFSLFLEKYTGRKTDIERELTRYLSQEEAEIKSQKVIRRNRLLAFLVICTVILGGASFLGKEVKKSKDIIQKQDGTMMIKRADNSYENIDLTVFGKSKEDGDEKVFNEEINITISPLRSEEPKYKENVFGKKSIAEKIKNEIRQLDRKGGNWLELPNKMEDGSPIYWKKKKEKNLFVYIIISFILMVILRQYKFFDVEISRKAAIYDTQKHLPHFTSQISLLLCSGMTFSNAFQKVMESKVGFVSKSYFYRNLYSIYIKNQKGQIEILVGLQDFAKNIAIREFMRIVNIILDNRSKGDELWIKLQKEAEILWFEQKKEMEERGRLSESKLILPLAIMLIILIIITVAPAMIDI